MRGPSPDTFSLEVRTARRRPGDHLGIGGTHQPELNGKLFFYNGNEAARHCSWARLRSRLRTWYHVALTRDGMEVRVYLNGQIEAEIAGSAEPGCSE